MCGMIAEFFVEWHAAWVRALFFPAVRALEAQAVSSPEFDIGCGCLACLSNRCDVDCSWCEENERFKVGAEAGAGDAAA